MLARCKQLGCAPYGAEYGGTIQPTGEDVAVRFSSAQSGELVMSHVDAEFGEVLHTRGLAGLCAALDNTDTLGSSAAVLSSCPGLS